jgi:hypothetical protein
MEGRKGFESSEFLFLSFYRFELNGRKKERERKNEREFRERITC